MINFGKIFPRKKWVVYYDLAKKSYHVDTYRTHKKLVAQGTDLHLLLIFLRQFDSRQAAETFAEKRREDDYNLDLG